MKGQGEILGVSSLKGGDFLTQDIVNLLPTPQTNWDVLTGYHFGGYAKTKEELFAFIRQFKNQHKILLDPIYTSKMALGFYDLLQQDYFKKGSSVVLIHTGGLQGWQGMIQQKRVDQIYVDEVLNSIQ